MRRTRQESKKPLYVAESLGGEPVYLSHDERATHTHIIGASGEGKSRLLEHMIVEDVKAGRGVCVIDPHGTLCRRLMPQLAARRLKPERLHLIQPGRPDWTFGFNPLGFEAQTQSQREFGIKAVVAATGYAWGETDMLRTPRLRTNLKLLYGALVDLGMTLPDARHFLVTSDYDGRRDTLIRQIRNPMIREAWHQIASMRPAQFNEMFESTRSRVNEFVHSSVLAPMFGQKEASIDNRALMDEGGVLLVDLSDFGGNFAEEDAQLFGTLLVNDFVLKAFQRPEGSPAFHVYIDECGRYLSPGIERILFEGRKFGLHLTLSHQDLTQLGKRDETMYGAIMSGAQTKICFRLSDMHHAREMAEQRMSSEIDYQRVKEKLTRWETVDHEIVILKGQSDGKGHSVTEGTSRTDTESESESEIYTVTTTSSESGGTSIGEGETLNTDDETVSTSTNSTETTSWTIGSSTSEGRSTSSGRSTSRSQSTSYTDSTSHTDSTGETFKPVLVERATQAYTIDEQQHAQAHEIYSLAQCHALILRRPQNGKIKIDRVTTPHVRDGDPRRERRRVERYEGRSLETSDHAVQLIEEQSPTTDQNMAVEMPPVAPGVIGEPQQEPESWAIPNSEAI